MRFKPLVTLIPLEKLIGFDQGLQNHLRDRHARHVGDLFIDRCGLRSGETETGEDFLMNRRSVWLKTDLFIPTKQEVAALHRLHLAARQYIQEATETNRNEVEAAIAAFRQRVLEDAAEEIIEEKTEEED